MQLQKNFDPIMRCLAIATESIFIIYFFQVWFDGVVCKKIHGHRVCWHFIQIWLIAKIKCQNVVYFVLFFKTVQRQYNPWLYFTCIRFTYVSCSWHQFTNLFSPIHEYFFNEIWYYDFFNDAVKCILMPPEDLEKDGWFQSRKKIFQ